MIKVSGLRTEGWWLTPWGFQLDRPAIVRDLANQLGDKADEILSSTAWHQFFSNVAVFVPGQDLDQMMAIVQALETAALLPDYRRRVLSWAPQNAQFNPGPVGAFIGRVIPAASSKRG